MDPYNAGALSLLPPIIAITLALWTKEVFSSLMIGILSGSLIYTVGMGQDFVIVRTIHLAGRRNPRLRQVGHPTHQGQDQRTALHQRPRRVHLY